MDMDIAYKVISLLEKAGFVNVSKTQFDHGYGALAYQPDQRDESAELYIECFRSIDSKMPPGTDLPLFPKSLCLMLFLCQLGKRATVRIELLTTLQSTDGTPGVARTRHEVHQFLEALEVEIKEHGYMPKLNLVRGKDLLHECLQGQIEVRPDYDGAGSM